MKTEIAAELRELVSGEQAARRKSAFLPTGIALPADILQWVDGLSIVVGCSRSQIVRGILARAREIDNNNGKSVRMGTQQ